MVRVHESHPHRVVIGSGALAQVADEVDRLGLSRILVVSTQSAAAPAAEVVTALAGRAVLHFDQPVVHTPVSVTEDLLRRTGVRDIDAVVAVGGGSAIGLSKAVSARTGASQVAVPTTYAGSEVTPVLGETANGEKTTRRDVALVPRTVIYDPQLTVSLPPGLTRTSALNAVAHAVEATYAHDATPLSDALASESVALLTGALAEVLQVPGDEGARERLQCGAWLAGLCLAQTSMGLHHQLAHALGGTFDLPHAELHALLLAHVMRYNLPHAPAAAARLERALGGDPVEVVAGLASGHDGPTTLRELGVPLDGLDAVAERVVASPYPNPRAVAHAGLMQLLHAAWG